MPAIGFPPPGVRSVPKTHPLLVFCPADNQAMSQPPDHHRNASSPVGVSSKSNRPGSVRMPLPTFPRATSPHAQGNPSSTTPQTPSPSSIGPLSPGGNPGSSSFVFPMRSVFQNMTQPEPISPSDGPAGSALSRAGSNQRPNRRDSLRPDSDSSNLIGISTIAQMLEESTISDKPEASKGPGYATFSSTRQQQHDKQAVSAGGVHQGKPISTPQGFFSVPALREHTESPFFNDEPRRASDPEHILSDQSLRPSLDHKDSSADTVRGDLPANASTDAEGSGLTDKSRPPVGQPQTRATEVNFRDRPGQITGDQQRYHEAGTSTARPPRREQQPPSGQPALQQPQPRRAGGTSQTSASTQSRSDSHTNIEFDDKGEHALVADYSGIVRLAEAGSLPSVGGTGDSGTGSRNRVQASGSAGSAPSGPTNARLAHSQRHFTQQPSNTRASVQNFINQQAQTTNLLDPNAPTPSPTPHGDPAESSTHRPSTDEDVEREWVESSDASLSVRDSSEMATASNDEEVISEPEEPIVTFRFEHVATDDGHHVVVGREGILQRCEDEPITTPGAVQGFGVLIVLEEDIESGNLTVRQVSENCTELLGLSPRYLFRLDCFTRVLTEDNEDLLRDNIEFLPDTASGKGSVEEEGPQVFLMSGFGEPGSDEDEDDEAESASAAARRREWTCWVAAHRPQQPSWKKTDAEGNPIAPPDLIVLEFELEKDVYNPLMHTFDEYYATPSEGTETGSNGTSMPRTDSSGSGQPASDGTTTTLASTPFPRPDSADTETTPRPESGTRMGSDSTQKVSSKPSSRVQPMGLEGVDVELPLERIIESTTNHAKPLRALERMRRTGQHKDGSSGTGSGNASRRARRPRRPPGSATGTMDVFAVLGQINEQLGSAPDLETFLKITVGVVQDLCRFHRVLIYQFDEAYNGQVVAELVEWGKTTDLFKGLMFPAADIPAQARQLYMINKVRLLYDRSQTTARMVLRSRQDLDTPLDMTHCYLRAMSPIHIKYLANMHVRSSMSVSIMAFGQLWGLIACHSYGHNGMRVSFPVRQMMRILSDSISRNIERLSYAHRLHTRKLISTIPSQHHPTGYIVSNADDLLSIFDADAGLLVIGDGCKMLGDSDQGTAMLAIAEYLRITRFDSIKATNHISRDFPDLSLPRAQDTIAGLLFVPLTAKAGQDFIVFLRKGQVREVQWAGKPYKDPQSDNQASLEPRKSFKTWSETVIGRSRTWTDDQLESAGVLALIYGKFIQVWREKQSAMASNQLTAILLSNTSHAVRTPLSQIINTLELALSGDIDADTRSMLENSHQASRALLFHVHDLLDLTRIETGNETAFHDPFDIRKSIADAIRLYQTEATRRDLEFRVNMAEDLPQHVLGDSRKVKTVVSNLVANAIKFTEHGHVEVYCGLYQSQGNEVVHVGENQVRLIIQISDTGCGISSDKLAAMFLTLEGAEEARPSANPGLGLGLAVVARIVEQLDGQLRAESEVGVGSRFFFTLPMTLHTGGLPTGVDAKSSSSGGSVVIRRKTSKSGSLESLRSSTSSQAPSEIDNFVHDFAVSHMHGPVAADDKRLLAAEERMSRPGTFPVTDSSYPVRPSRVDTDTEQSTSPPPMQSPGQLLDPPQVPKRLAFGRDISYQTRASEQKRLTQAEPTDTTSREGSKLRVLVVEDDPINSQILQKRLRMDKHTAIPVTNGQEAVDFLRTDRDIDVVLMDIQMPIMDGRTAALEIRKLEAASEPIPTKSLRVDGRIPIFAVSASLYESDRSDLAENFDGWLLKPLDFARVRTLIAALLQPGKRSEEVYQQGQWEKGGFLRAARTPSPGSSSVANSPSIGNSPVFRKSSSSK